MARVATANNPERTSRLMIIAALVFAALAAVLVFVALHKSSGNSTSSAVAASQDVVVAKQDIDVNTKITADMVAVKSLPSDQVISGAYATTVGLIGLPARYPIAAGEQVTPTKIGLQLIKDEKDISLVLPPGTRGFSIHASQVTAVGGLLLASNSVDIIAVYDEPFTGRKKASTVLQNITVISVAQEAQQPVPAASDTSATPGAAQGISGVRPSDVKRQPDASTVTLAVTPDQAQLLAALQSQDSVSLWISLRPSDDKSSVPLNDTTLQQYFGP
jgi:Flp pilus assembly protein CpaB